MPAAVQFAYQFREVFLNGKWIANTNFKEQLSTLSWKQATQKTEPLNTIAILTAHVNYYIEGIVHFFETGKLEISDKHSFDFPPVSSQQEWENTVQNLLENAEKFAQKVEQMSDEKLQEHFFDEKYGSYQRNILAMIEHAYYHLGQIVLIKKLQDYNS